MIVSAAPPCARTAIGITASIDIGVEELTQQIAMRRNQFDPIQPSLAHVCSRNFKAIYDLFDQEQRQLARHDVKPLVWHCRWGIGHWMRAISGKRHFATGVRELREYETTVRLTGFR